MKSENVGGLPKDILLYSRGNGFRSKYCVGGRRTKGTKLREDVVKLEGYEKWRLVKGPVTKGALTTLSKMSNDAGRTVNK